jgi:putative transposase
MTGWEPDDCHEKVQVHGVTDRVCAAAAESGFTVAEVCRKLGISEATFYSWKKKFSGLGPVELRRLRQVEEENAQLKRIVAPDAGQTDAAGCA